MDKCLHCGYRGPQEEFWFLTNDGEIVLSICSTCYQEGVLEQYAKPNEIYIGE